MRLLAIDTSSKYLSLALAEDEKILCQLHRLLDRKHSTRLARFIEQLLKTSKVSLKKIDGFCVSKGPGSFTGLRIGITTIKGLAFVLGKPVVAVPTLDILVQNSKKIKIRERNSSLWVCPLVDAKQGKVYTGLYQVNKEKILRRSGYWLLPLKELIKKLKGKTIFLGDALRLYRREILRYKGIKPIFTEERLWYPKASAAIPLAIERFQKKDFDDVDNLAPLYLYPKECQIK